jgi:PAS domain S-box-containing protein
MTSIKKLLLKNMLFITFISFAGLYSLWVWNEYTQFKKESASIREQFVVSEKERLKTQVQAVLEYVRYMRGQAEKRRRGSIEARVNEAHAADINTAGDDVEDMEKEIQKEVLERIATLRFGKEGYFFGSMFGGAPLFTDGKITKGMASVWHLTDPGGVRIIQEQNRAARAPGGGFVSYSWRKLDSETPSPKLSYVAAIPEWEWIIGAGVYLDTMDEVIVSKKTDLYHDFVTQAVLYFGFMFGIAFLIFFWTRYQTRRLQSGIRLFSDFFETASSQATTIDPARLQFEEFQRIARAANEMIETRTRAVQALRDSEEKYRLMAENVSDVITVLDMNLRFTYISPSISRLTGYPVEEAMQFSVEDVLPPDSLQKIRTVIQEELAAEAAGNSDPDRSRIIEYQQYVKGNSIVWVESNCRFLRDSEQIPRGFLIISRDITERKHAEAEKETLQAQLNQARKMETVGRLAGGVAHDFNNMLGVILGRTELALLKTDEHHDLHSDLEEIQKAAKRSADITKQLLAFARKQTISPRKLDLNDTVASMLKMLRRLIGENIELVWQPSAHLWPVKMDPAQIHQILVNLCVNARDAIEGVGKITIETEKKTFDAAYCKDHSGVLPGDFVQLSVSDNGCGMDRDTLDKLFEPFFTTKEVGKGTGLGLATIYGIVKQNSGFIDVYSEPGQGSTFKIYLPRK